MTETQTFFFDIIQLVPVGSVCFIQAPSLDDFEYQQVMQSSPFPYFQHVVLTAENKERLSKLVKLKQLEKYFHSLEVRVEGNLLLEAFDGMEIGTFSKKFKLPVNLKISIKAWERLLFQGNGKAIHNFGQCYTTA